METNTNNAAISIIIPHWENIDGLEILLESIRQEACKHPNLSETIVVDDYSCPETQQKLRDLQNRFDFHLYFNNSIKSAGTCRNIGIEKSTGQWLLFADSDDYFLPGFLDATKKYLSSDYDIVFFPPTSVEYNNHEIVSDRHHDFIKLLKKYHQNQDNELDIRYKWLSPWSKLIRKSLPTLNNIRFDSVIVRNDALFSVCTGYYAKRITVSCRTIYAVTRRVGSLIYQETANHYLSRIETTIKVNRFLVSHKLSKHQTPYLLRLFYIFRKYGMKTFLKAIVLIISTEKNVLQSFGDNIARYMCYSKLESHFFQKILNKLQNPVHETQEPL